jgi:hypothetical protein
VSGPQQPVYQAPAYVAVSPAQVHAAVPRKLHPVAILLVIGAALGVLMLGFGIVAVVLRPAAPVSQKCPPDCTPPPPSTAPPLTSPEHYTSSALGYSLDYDGTDNGKPAHSDANGVGWSVQGYFYEATGQRPAGKSDEELTDAAAAAKFPGAVPAYTIPAAELGYNPGFGRVYDTVLRSPAGQSQKARIVVITAIKNDLAVTVLAVGPYVNITQGHPVPASTKVVILLRTIMATLTWPGDNPP